MLLRTLPTKLLNNNIDVTEPPLIMDAMFEESPIQEVSNDCILPAPLTHLYDGKFKAYS